MHRHGRVPKLRITTYFRTGSLAWLEDLYRDAIRANNPPEQQDWRPHLYPTNEFLETCGGGSWETRYRTAGDLKSAYVRNQGKRPVLYMEENWATPDRRNHKWALLSSVVCAAEMERKSSVCWWVFCEDSEQVNDRRWFDYRRHPDNTIWICLRQDIRYWGGGHYRREEAKAAMRAAWAKGGNSDN